MTRPLTPIERADIDGWTLGPWIHRTSITGDAEPRRYWLRSVRRRFLWWSYEATERRIAVRVCVFPTAFSHDGRIKRDFILQGCDEADAWLGDDRAAQRAKEAAYREVTP